jgi:peptidoglycan/xylan/chitin deacetylase (PgdA/CDA1 family)
MSRLSSALVGLAAGVVVGAAAVHAAPAITAISPARRRLLPDLAGIGADGHVALTFDDGPDPRSTPAFLDLLDQHRIKATFFLLGYMLNQARSLGREIADAGHEIALHGYFHRCLIFRTPAATYDDLARGRDLVGDVTGTAPTRYRPPYGVLTTSTLHATRRLDLTPVLWTAWGRDWSAKATPQSVFDTVNGRLAGGGTVLLHDSDCTSAPGSWRRTLAALPRLIDEVDRRGLRLGPLAAHGWPTGARELATAGASPDGGTARSGVT